MKHSLPRARSATSTAPSLPTARAWWPASGAPYTTGTNNFFTPQAMCEEREDHNHFTTRLSKEPYKSWGK